MAGGSFTPKTSFLAKEPVEKLPVIPSGLLAVIIILN